MKIFLLLSAVVLSGCDSIGYYSQAAGGQLSLLNKREPIAKLLEQDDLDPTFRSRLELVLNVRTFAENELQLPVGKAYSSYSDLEREFALWNIYAAPELSLKPHTWCVPFLGCMAYRGYFKESKAQRVSEKLVAQGYDVRVGGVRAYSTLGVFSDPVLNTFLFKSEPYLVELLIHEISHRQLYIKGDTKFNESFATAVATLGTQIWYEQRGQPDVYKHYLENREKSEKIFVIVNRYRDKLNLLFGNESLNREEKLQQKNRLYAALRLEYQQTKEDQGWGNGWDNWIKNLNNASLATFSNYKGFEKEFMNLFFKKGNWTDFYNEVETLSKKSQIERDYFLKSLQ